MTQSKFTPAPWVAESHKWDDCHITSTKREGMVEICKVSSAYLDIPRLDTAQLSEFESEQIANARLIAKSPELYEMLKLARSKLSLHMVDIDGNGNNFRDLRELIDELIEEVDG